MLNKTNNTSTGSFNHIDSYPKENSERSNPAPSAHQQHLTACKIGSVNNLHIYTAAAIQDPDTIIKNRNTQLKNYKQKARAKEYKLLQQQQTQKKTIKLVLSEFKNLEKKHKDLVSESQDIQQMQQKTIETQYKQVNDLKRKSENLKHQQDGLQKIIRAQSNQFEAAQHECESLKKKLRIEDAEHVSAIQLEQRRNEAIYARLQNVEASYKQLYENRQNEHFMRQQESEGSKQQSRTKDVEHVLAVQLEQKRNEEWVQKLGNMINNAMLNPLTPQSSTFQAQNRPQNVYHDLTGHVVYPYRAEMLQGRNFPTFYPPPTQPARGTKREREPSSSDHNESRRN